MSICTTAAWLCALVLVPTLVLATPQTQIPTPARVDPSGTVHATSGVVKTIEATSLVIARSSGTTKEEMTFVVNASTQKKGTLAAGAKVDVRYRTDGKTKIATAISVQTRK